MITNSLDWAKEETFLRKNARSIKFNRDAYKMIDNIRAEVTKLSIAEIAARRGRPAEARQLLIKINQDIELLKEYIVIGALMK